MWEITHMMTDKCQISQFCDQQSTPHIDSIHQQPTSLDSHNLKSQMKQTWWMMRSMMWCCWCLDLFFLTENSQRNKNTLVAIYQQVGPLFLRSISLYASLSPHHLELLSLLSLQQFKECLRGTHDRIYHCEYRTCLLFQIKEAPVVFLVNEVGKITHTPQENVARSFFRTIR